LTSLFAFCCLLSYDKNTAHEKAEDFFLLSEADEAETHEGFVLALGLSLADRVSAGCGILCPSTKLELVGTQTLQVAAYRQP